MCVSRLTDRREAACAGHRGVLRFAVLRLTQQVLRAGTSYFSVFEILAKVFVNIYVFRFW